MNDLNEKPICYKKDLDEIISLFRGSIESELDNDPTIHIDVEKLIQEFENKLRENLQISHSIEENQADKNAKNEIKRMQAEANQIKSSIKKYQTNFYDNVQKQIEQELNSKLPRIERFEENEDYLQNPELLYNLNLLDKNIEKLQKKVFDKNDAVIKCLEKNTEFARSISTSMNND